MDDREIDAVFLLEISRDFSHDIEEIKSRITCEYVNFTFYNTETGLRTFETFADFLHFIHVQKINYVFAFDSVNFACSLDWGIHNMTASGRVFERLKAGDTRDEEGNYKRVDREAFAELSGESGQRYQFQIWTKDKGRRADGAGVMRRESVHGCDYYFFDNIIKRPFAEVCKAYGVEGEENDAEKLYKILLRFDMECFACVGEKLLNENKKRPLAITCGGLAKYELLRHLSDKKTHAARVKDYKKRHPLNDKQADFLRHSKLLRGGINYISADAKIRGVYRGLYKYDVNSEYTAVSCKMNDLTGDLKAVPPEEFFNPSPHYEYILITREFRGDLLAGMPPIFTNPFTGKEEERINILKEFAIFRTEYDALCNFYEFFDIVPLCCLKVKKANNGGYSDYGEKYFDYKLSARIGGDSARESFSKLMLNSGIGKLAEKAHFNTVEHNFKKFEGMTGDIVQEVIKSEAESDFGGAGLGFVIGAYVVALGRVHLMKNILRIAEYNGVTPAEVLIYSDTDSIITAYEAPPDIVGLEMGKLKLEGNFDFSKFIDKKVYMNISKNERKIDIHCRGIQREAIEEVILYNYGEEDIFTIPFEAFDAAFNTGRIYSIKVNFRVSGGRCVLYAQRGISASMDMKARRTGGLSRIAAKNIIEI